MNPRPPHDSANHSEPPLWSIGLAVIVIVAAPVVIYSLAPTGPLREGDTVFSDGQQRVLKTEEGSSSQLTDSCLLDPSHPLIIIRPPMDRLEGSIVAQVQGNPTIEWPFCPPHTTVLLTTHQIFQKPEPLRKVQETILRWFGRSQR